jgi:hypothetical protein
MGRLICDISETRNFNRESDFAQAVRDQYFSYVAADASPPTRRRCRKLLCQKYPAWRIED